MNHSINFVLNQKDIEDIDKNKCIQNLNSCKEPTKTIIECITQFINLIRVKEDNKNNEKLFLEKFIYSLFGYCSEEKEKKNAQVKELVNDLINFIIKN